MSNSNLIRNVNSLMAKRRLKLIPKLNLVGFLMFTNKIKLNLNQCINIFRNKHCLYCSNTRKYLADLPYAFWFEVLAFLSVFDIVNLHIFSKRFKGLILNRRINYKHLFESMDYVCDAENRNLVLSFNFSIFFKFTEKIFDDDLQLFLFKVLIFFLFCFVLFFQIFIFNFLTFLFL